MLAEAGDALVKLPPGLEDRPGVLRQRLLLPGVLRGAQQRDQGRRGGDVHPAGHGMLQQARIVLKRRGKERFTRDEQHHELRCRRQRGPVRLGGQPVHVLAQVPGMRGEPGFAHGLVGGPGGFEVGRERDLGIHHDVLAPGQVDHHVRAQ